METYYRRRCKNSQQSINPNGVNPFSAGYCTNLQGQAVGGVENQIENHVEVGYLFEIDHIHLPPSTGALLSSIRVAMVCEKTELIIAVRYPSKESLRAFFSYSSRETHPALDEKFVMANVVAEKVLYRKISAEEYSDQKHLESFWVVNSTTFVNSRKSDSSLSKDMGPCLSGLDCKFMVRWGSRRQVKYLGRHKENGGDSNRINKSSGSFVNTAGDDEKGKAEEEQGEEEVNEAQCDDIDDVGKEIPKEEHEEISEEENVDDEEDHEEEGEEEEEEEEYVNEAESDLKRKRYAFRNRNIKKGKKVKIETTKETQKHKKKQSKRGKSRNKFREALILRNPKDRWSSQRYKLAENSLLQVMKENGATADNPIMRPQLRAEARKKIGDTGLLDHLLKHMAGKLAPGGEQRFRRRHNADGAMEYWLESADLVNIRKEAGVSDPYWVPPPGWKPGDSPTQDPICARELKLMKEEISTLKRDMELMATKMQLEEEVRKLRSERDELFSSKKTAEKNEVITLSSCPCDISQKLNQIGNSLTTDVDRAPAISLLEKFKQQLVVINDCVKELEQVSANAEKRMRSEKEAHIQRLKSGFRLCKPQGTFLWPSMVKSSSSPQVLVQVEVPTPPSSVSSSSASGPLFHRHNPASPVKPVAERRAIIVSVSNASNSLSYEDGPTLSLSPILSPTNYGTRS